MADMVIVNARVMNKTATTAEWEATDTLLLKGEIALADPLTTPRMKVGDGIHTFNELPWFLTNGSVPASYTNDVFDI